MAMECVSLYRLELQLGVAAQSVSLAGCGCVAGDAQSGAPTCSWVDCDYVTVIHYKRPSLLVFMGCVVVGSVIIAVLPGISLGRHVSCRVRQQVAKGLAFQHNEYTA